MSIIQTLHNFLKLSLPGIHGARLQALMAAVEAGLSGASMSITALGLDLSAPAFIKHNLVPRIRNNGKNAANRVPRIKT